MGEYKLTEGTSIMRVVDGVIMAIPSDPNNLERREYDEWVARGGIPDPIEEPTPDPEEEAREVLRVSAMEKIITNAGLSEEEAAVIFPRP